MRKGSQYIVIVAKLFPYSPIGARFSSQIFSFSVIKWDSPCLELSGMLFFSVFSWNVFFGYFLESENKCFGGLVDLWRDVLVELEEKDLPHFLFIFFCPYSINIVILILYIGCRICCEVGGKVKNSTSCVLLFEPHIPVRVRTKL